MTSHRMTSITCDGGGGNYTCTTPEYFAGPDEDATQARKFLRSLGWRYVPRKGRPPLDLCPEHAHEAVS